jgi:tetratricopeptide (TPR) repeat protein
MSCPEHEIVVAYVEDLLEPAARASLEAHADGCAPCRRLLAQLARAAWGAITIEPAPGSPPPVSGSAKSREGDQDPSRAAYPLQAGDQLGRYRIRSLLGRGGASAVYRAVQSESGREVAIKVHAPFSGDDAGWRWRLRREFFLMAQWHHPHIVRVLDWDEHDGLLYYVMELVDGRDASGLTPMRPDQVIEVMAGVASALGMIHNHGLLHRDIKPHNILIPFGPGGGLDVQGALLTDFGLLVRLDEGASDRSGTPGYMAPERLLGAPADIRDDLYGLGAAAFALLTGAPPPLLFGDESLVSLPSDVPEQLAILLGQLLAPDPRVRPRSAPEVLARLAPLRQAEEAPIEPARVRALLRSPPLVEREEALSALRAVWAETLAGRGGGPAFVLSAPGLGRSRVLRQFALELRAGGVRVVEAAAIAGGPLELVAQLVRAMAGDPQLEPLPEGLLGRAGHGVDRGALSRQAVDVLVGAARARPTVLCIDDLDLADDPSLDVVEQVSRAAHGLSLLVLCSARLGPAEATVSLARLRRSALHVCILDRLGLAGVESVLEGLFGENAATRALVEQLDQASGGNPKLLLDLIEALVDEGQALLVAGRWRLPREIEGVERLRGPHDLLEMRRSGSSPSARALADLLALCRDPVEPSVLAAASQLDRRQLLEGLEELGDRHLVRTGAHGTVSISDPLVARTLEEAQSAETRRRGNMCLARALRARHAGKDLDESDRVQLELDIGRHELAAGGEHELDGASWLIRAARRLIGDGVFSAAIEPLRQATAVLEQNGGAERHPELLELWEQLGVASLMRDGGLSLACFERLVGHLDRGGELSAIARAGRFGRVGIVGGAAVTVGRRVLHRRWRDVLALPSEADRYVRGLAYLGVVEAQVALLDAARDHIEQLEVFARARGRDAEAIGIVARAHWSFSIGRLDEVRALSRAGLAVLERKPGALDADNARRARSSLELIGAWADALTASPATRSFDPSAAIDEMFEMHMLMLPAVRHAARGEVRELIEARALLFARCFRLRSGWQEAFIFAPTAPALMDAGLVAQLQDDVALLFDLDVPPSPWRKIIRRTVPGMLLLAQGRCQRAIELFDEALAVVHAEASGSAMYVVHALQLAAEARVEAGRHEEAEARLREVIEIGEAPDTRHPPASIRARRVLLRSTLARGELDGAARALDEAAAALGLVDLPGERAALSLLDAELALARGDRTAAAGRARTAQEMFVKLGNPLGAERALALRRRSGDHVGSSPPVVVESSARPDAATVTMTSRGSVDQEPTELDPAPAQVSDPRRR